MAWVEQHRHRDGLVDHHFDADDIARLVMIGDSRIDVAAGKAAGMKTCGYIPGFRGRTELAEAGADYLIERFGELKILVET